MEFNQLLAISRDIRDSYAELNRRKGKNPWELAEHLQGLVGDVGDLVKLGLAKNNFRDDKDVDRRLRHELADCLYALLVIAHELNIDLEKEFIINMEYLRQKLIEQLNTKE